MFLCKYRCVVSYLNSLSGLRIFLRPLKRDLRTLGPVEVFDRSRGLITRVSRDYRCHPLSHFSLGRFSESLTRGGVVFINFPSIGIRPWDHLSDGHQTTTLGGVSDDIPIIRALTNGDTGTLVLMSFLGHLVGKDVVVVVWLIDVVFFGRGRIFWEEV